MLQQDQNLPSIESLVDEFLNLPYDELQGFINDLTLADPTGLTEILKDQAVKLRLVYFRAYEARSAAELATYGKKIWN